MKNRFKSRRAQTITELAVFGAVLVFILGTMIRYALSNSYAQGQGLKALRMAMAMSFRSGEAGNSSRDLTSLTFVQDHTTAGVTKYGPLDRSPYMANVAVTYSKNLNMPLDYDSREDLPVMDVIINGQWFAFTTAEFIQIIIAKDNNLPKCNLCNAYSNDRWKADWNNACGTHCGDPYGCRMVYFKTPNLNRNAFFSQTCRGWFKPTPFDPGDDSGCFDLYRDLSKIVPEPDRKTFGWQWHQVRATTKDIDVAKGKNTYVDVDGDLKEERVLETWDVEGTKHTPYDAEKDDFELPLDAVGVLDYQRGDVDLTWTEGGKNDSQFQPGLKQDAQMLSYTRDGTYLLIEEGPLSGVNQQARSTQKRNRLDIVQRIFQLSNDNLKYCDETGVLRAGGGPVEACNDCFSDDNIFKTCFDQSEKRLYIRSKIEDLRGRKWLTDYGKTKDIKEYGN